MNTDQLKKDFPTWEEAIKALAEINEDYERQLENQKSLVRYACDKMEYFISILPNKREVTILLMENFEKRTSIEETDTDAKEQKEYFNSRLEKLKKLELAINRIEEGKNIKLDIEYDKVG